MHISGPVVTIHDVLNQQWVKVQLLNSTLFLVECYWINRLHPQLQEQQIHEKRLLLWVSQRCRFVHHQDFEHFWCYVITSIVSLINFICETELFSMLNRCSISWVVKMVVNILSNVLSYSKSSRFKANFLHLFRGTVSSSIVLINSRSISSSLSSITSSTALSKSVSGSSF